MRIGIQGLRKNNTEVEVVMRKQRGEIKGEKNFQSGLWGIRKVMTEKKKL